MKDLVIPLAVIAYRGWSGLLTVIANPRRRWSKRLTVIAEYSILEVNHPPSVCHSRESGNLKISFYGNKS